MWGVQWEGSDVPPGVFLLVVDGVVVDHFLHVPLVGRRRLTTMMGANMPDMKPQALQEARGQAPDWAQEMDFPGILKPAKPRPGLSAAGTAMNNLQGQVQ